MSRLQRSVLACFAAALLAVGCAPLALADGPTDDGAWGSGTSGDTIGCIAPSR